MEVSVVLLTRKAELWKIRLTQKTGLYRTQRGKKPEEGKGAALSKRPAPQWCPRGTTKHKNAECKRCVKESWPREKKRKSGTIGLTVYGP
jgi:hypothetical protein